MMTYIALQFWFLTSDAFVNNYIALGLATISWLLVFFWLPESPRFLYSKKQFQKARDVILRIATVNGTESRFNRDFVFIAEEQAAKG